MKSSSSAQPSSRLSDSPFVMHRMRRKEVPLKPYFPFPTGKTLFPITRFRKDITIERAPMAKGYLLPQQLRRVISHLLEIIQNIQMSLRLSMYIYLCLCMSKKSHVLLKHGSLIRLSSILSDAIASKRVSLLSFPTFARRSQ